MTIQNALGGMAALPQWFVWRLTWDAEEGKYDKAPCDNPHAPYPINAQLPHNWLTYEACMQRVAQFQAADPTRRYAPGFMLTEGCGYWFWDLDKCYDPTTRQYSPLAAQLLPSFTGSFFEFSSSGTGVHVIGRGALPEHAKRCKAHGMELYTSKRGIAFGLTGEAWGSVDFTGSHAQAVALAAQYFPPGADVEAGAYLQPRADWAGPEDDDTLIARACASSSVAAKFGVKATFRQLWEADESALSQFYSDSDGKPARTERDAALAAHLAFWTGCDAPRMERLMRRSALAREKWDSHRTYLRELTIERACARQGDVYRDRQTRQADALYARPAVVLPPLPVLAPLPALALPAAPVGLQPLPAVNAPAISPELEAQVDALIAMVNSSGTWAEIHNAVIPAIKAAALPPAVMPRMETAVNKRLDLFGAKLAINELRALMRVSTLATPEAADASPVMPTPEWAANYAYVQQVDDFFDIADGSTLSRTSFNALHNRKMPIKGDGPGRHDAAQFMLEHWGCPVVFDTIYYPGQANVLEYEGRTWANLYTEKSFPKAAPQFTHNALTQIERFKHQLWHMCSYRQEVYEALLNWMAHCVQFPGVKIRWAPIIKGIEGDGKTMLSNVMRAAMGSRNTINVGPAIVANQGGFTDWAHGHAFVALEEIYLPGKDRHRIYNVLKEFITNNQVTINQKGGKNKKVINTCNQMAFTNHTDALPLNALTDRRWLVIFTPWGDLAHMRRILGIERANEHFKPLTASLQQEPEQWRKWLMEYQISASFDPDEPAIMTAEKHTMANSGKEDFELMVTSLIEMGAYGVSRDILSSASLSVAIKLASHDQGFDLPKTQTMHHMLNRLGYTPVEKLLKWGGKPHRVWVKPGHSQDPDNLRMLLNLTAESLK